MGKEGRGKGEGAIGHKGIREEDSLGRINCVKGSLIWEEWWKVGKRKEMVGEGGKNKLLRNERLGGEDTTTLL